MGLGLRYSSVTERCGYAPSSRLAPGPIGAQRLYSYFWDTTLASFAANAAHLLFRRRLVSLPQPFQSLRQGLLFQAWSVCLFAGAKAVLVDFRFAAIMVRRLPGALIINENILLRPLWKPPLL